MRVDPQLGMRLCEAWGLDPERVTSIAIDVDPTGATVLIGFIADDELETEFAKYRLEPLGGDA